MYDRHDFINSELPLKRTLLKWFSKKDKLIIFDIGACEGEDSIRYSKIFPLSTIYSFEPLPSNIEIFQNNLNAYSVDNIKLFQLALSNEMGEKKFYVSNGKPNNILEDLNWDFGNKSSSLLPPEKHPEVTPWLKFEKVIDVKVDTLKNFILFHNLEKIDFLHLDVQGAELKVLLGAEHLLKKIKMIWLEVSNIELYKNQPLRSDIEKFLKEQGFKLLKSEMNNDFGDQLYVNRRFLLQFNFYKLIKKVIQN